MPAKPKKASKAVKKDGEEEHARATDSDEDQNLSQPADGCVLPQGQVVAAEPAPAGGVIATPVSDVDGGGISSGLLIGAGVLAAVGVGVLALANGKDKNGAPVATADTATVAEGASLSGSVATNDTDPDNDTLTFALTGTAPAGLTFNSNGSFTFDANNAAYNGLAAGATQTVTVPYTVTDPDGATASSTLTITVTGTNDAPTAVAVTGPGATEGGAAVTATVAGVDPDTGAVLTYSLVNPVAGVTINGTTGVVTLNPADPAYNSLAAGQVQQVPVSVRVADAQGASVTTTVTFAVTGTNDAPVAVAQTGPAATEGGAVVTGTFAATDPDQGAVLTYALVEPVAGLTINATTGAFSFDPANAAYNNLAAGATQNVVANVRVTDAQGASTTQTLTFVVTGANDAPTAVNDVAAVNEDATVTGNLRTNDTDPDAGAALTYTVVGAAPAGLTVNSDGTFTFNAANAAYQNLAAGATRVVTANIAVSDGTAPAVNTTLTITVTGTNDTPIAVADVAAGVEGAGNLTGSVATNDSDPDDGAVLTYTANGAVPAGLTLNADGTYTFDLNNAAYDGLAAGATQNVVLNYTVTDQQGASATSTLTITVTGTADGPVVIAQSLDVDNDGNPLTTFTLPVSADTGTFAYTDLSAVANTVQVNGFGGDDTITFDLPVSSVAFGSDDYDNDGVVDDLLITTNVGGNVSSILLVNAVAANSVVFDEASAEAAVGNGFDNFRFAGQVTPPPAGTTPGLLDVDNDGNVLTARTFDAGTDGFRFVEDADIANTVIITNFGADDRIVFEAGNTYSFSSDALDTDGLPNDLIISLNKGGLVSEIVIKDVLPVGAFVSNEAQAEVALGNIDYFQFA